MAAIEADIVCGARTDEFRHKLIDSMIGIAGDPQVSDAERKKALAEAQQTIDHAGTWRDAEHLADYYWGRKDNLNAFTWYERGLAFISARPAEHASANDIKQLETRASAAKSSASDDNGGKKPAQFASSRGDMDGRVGGIYSPDLLRGAEVEVVPLPINFVTGEATFTPVGEKAAAELAEAVKQQNVHVVTLVGHTDPRGEHQYNVALSIQGPKRCGPISRVMASPRRSMSTARGRMSPSTPRCWVDRSARTRSMRSIGASNGSGIPRASRGVERGGLRYDQAGQEGDSGRGGGRYLAQHLCGGPRGFCARLAEERSASS